MSAQPSLGLAPAPRSPLALVVDPLPPPFSLIEPFPGGLKTYASLEALAARCADLLEGRRPELVLTVGAYPPFGGVPLVSVRVAASGQTPHQYLASAAVLGSDPRADLTRLRAAIDDANHNRRN